MTFDELFESRGKEYRTAFLTGVLHRALEVEQPENLEVEHVPTEEIYEMLEALAYKFGYTVKRSENVHDNFAYTLLIRTLKI